MHHFVFREILIDEAARRKLSYYLPATHGTRNACVGRPIDSWRGIANRRIRSILLNVRFGEKSCAFMLCAAFFEMQTLATLDNTIDMAPRQWTSELRRDCEFGPQCRILLHDMQFQCRTT